MNVLPVFGSNLRLLCAAKGTIAENARAIGVGSVQFNRYLNGTSFPKPHMLQKVCDHFGVDARILTDPLTKSDLRLLELGYSLRSFVPLETSFAEAMNFVMPSEFHFSQDVNVPDGLYAIYRNSPSFPGKVNINIFQIRSLATCRVVRGYQHKSTSVALGDPVDPSAREFRGILLRQREGFAFSTVHASPFNIVCHHYFTPHASIAYTFSGIMFLCRSEGFSAPRISRAYMKLLDPKSESVLDFARRCPLVEMDDVPKTVQDLLLEPVK